MHVGFKKVCLSLMSLSKSVEMVQKVGKEVNLGIKEGFPPLYDWPPEVECW